MKLKRMDVVLVLGVIVLAVGGFFIYNVLGKKEAGTVVVEVDGEVFGKYTLQENREILIDDTNVLIIENREANMYEADCPDQICVEHKPISRTGETIVCLPNKVVVTITEAKTAEYDAVAN